MNLKILFCLAAFSVVMTAYKWATGALVTAYGWPIAVPILIALFTYAAAVDRRTRRLRSEQPRETI